MEIILDADVLIRGEKGSFDLRGWLTSRREDAFGVAAITVVELCHGIERASQPHRSKREGYLRAILANLPIIPYTEVTAYFHAKLWANLQSGGKMIGYYDVIVAATALELGCAVATFNRKHFSVVADLKVIDPLQL